MSTPVSDRKIEANRCNALRSTGPRTEQGKARSSQNAITHGIFCKHLVVAVDDPEQVRAFKREMLIALNPHNLIEQQLVEQIIFDEIRIQRVRAAERKVYASTTRQPDNRPAPSFVSFVTKKKLATAERDAIEQYQRCEQRLRSSIYRAMKELREIQSKGLHRDEQIADHTLGLLNADPDAPPAEQSVESPAAPVKNEPTDSASVGEATSYEPIATALTNQNRDIPAPAERIEPPASPDRADSDARAA